MLTEADTCRKYVLPALYAAGWNDDQISEQKSFTDGRIIVAGATARRGPQKRADYLLRYRSNLMLVVVEAKASYKKSRDGLQQAKMDALKRAQAKAAAKLDALLPSILDRAFAGDL